MCGIAGLYAPKGFREGDIQSNIRAMLRALTHRGPDAEGIWLDINNDGLALGHRRLSIIDLTDTGAQPMISHDGRYVISYNGEIYNTSSLIEEIRSHDLSIHMNGTSDTEILLTYIECFGVAEAVTKCKGMFAIALYDREERTLTLIRDRIGEKPLYYGYVNDAFVFASELGAIRGLGGFEGDLNYDCIADYLKHGYIPAPASIYKNIHKLEAGCWFKIKCEFNKYTNFETNSYWNITDVAIHGQSNLFRGTRQEAADELERKLSSAIRGQMVSDVPLGAFLSAGIDSPTIVSLMQAQSEAPVRTFTIGFEEADYNEADAAALIARELGCEHTELYASKTDALEVIPKLPTIFGEPFADMSQIPTYLVSRLTKEHVTVSLSGDGGDELFAGYRDYAGVYGIYNRIRNIPTPLRNIGGCLMEHIPGDRSRRRRLRAHGTLLRASDPADLYRRTYETWRGLEGLTGEAVRESVTRAGRISSCAYGDTKRFNLFGDDVIHTAMLMNLKMYHPDDILVKVDRAAMAVSLETRVPMLDRDVVEFAWTLPLEYLTDGKTGKLVLRDVLYKYADRKLFDRPKQGFGVPIAEWLRGNELKSWAEELLNSDLINKYKILDAAAVRRLWDDYINRGIWRPQIWYVLMLGAWCEENL